MPSIFATTVTCPAFNPFIIPVSESIEAISLSVTRFSKPAGFRSMYHFTDDLFALIGVVVTLNRFVVPTNKSLGVFILNEVIASFSTILTLTVLVISP